MSASETTGSTVTDYGFRWGRNAQIIRACEQRGHRVLLVETTTQRLLVRITPSGLIRLDEGGPIVIGGAKDV